MEMVNTVVPNFSASNSAPNLSLTKLQISQQVHYYIRSLCVCVFPRRVAIQPHILFLTLQRPSQGTGRLRTHVLKWADVSYMQDKVRALFRFDSGLQLLICSKDAPACTASGGDNA